MCNTALLWALWDPSCHWELRWLISKLVWGCNCPFSSRSLHITKPHSSTHSVAPKTAAQRGFWHTIRIHHECKSVSYGAWEIWEASSIFSNLRCAVGFVICLFSTKLDCNKILLSGEPTAEAGHGNTALFFVCGYMHSTCFMTRSNTEEQARVHDTHMCTQFRQRFTAFSLLLHYLTFTLFHLFFFFSPFFCLFSHMEPAERQAEYVQVSLLCPGVCAPVCAFVLPSFVCVCVHECVVCLCRLMCFCCNWILSYRNISR